MNQTVWYSFSFLGNFQFIIVQENGASGQKAVLVLCGFVASFIKCNKTSDLIDKVHQSLGHSSPIKVRVVFFSNIFSLALYTTPFMQY